MSEAFPSSSMSWIRAGAPSAGGSVTDHDSRVLPRNDPEEYAPNNRVLFPTTSPLTVETSASLRFARRHLSGQPKERYRSMQWLLSDVWRGRATPTEAWDNVAGSDVRACMASFGRAVDRVRGMLNWIDARLRMTLLVACTMSLLIASLLWQWHEELQLAAIVAADDSPVPAYLSDADPQELVATAKAMCPVVAYIPRGGSGRRSRQKALRQRCPEWDALDRMLGTMVLPVQAPEFDPGPGDPPEGEGGHWQGANWREAGVVLHRAAMVAARLPEEEEGEVAEAGQIVEGPPIAANYSSCAVVGSDGVSLSGRRLGSAINAHSFVIRFNDAPTKGYELDVGKFTSLRVQAEEQCGWAEGAEEGCMVAGGRGGQEAEEACYLRTAALRPGSLQPRCTAVHTSRRLHRFAATYWGQLAKATAKDRDADRWNEARAADGGCHLYKGTGTRECLQPLSSGLFGIMLALNMCARVDVYGFSLASLEAHLPGEQGLYYDADGSPYSRLLNPWGPRGGRGRRNASAGQVANTKLTWDHHWVLEKELLQQLRRWPTLSATLAFY